MNRKMTLFALASKCGFFGANGFAEALRLALHEPRQRDSAEAAPGPEQEVPAVDRWRHVGCHSLRVRGTRGPPQAGYRPPMITIFPAVAWTGNDSLTGPWK